jgi:hypothetical protein
MSRCPPFLASILRKGFHLRTKAMHGKKRMANVKFEALEIHLCFQVPSQPTILTSLRALGSAPKVQRGDHVFAQLVFVREQDL